MLATGDDSAKTRLRKLLKTGEISDRLILARMAGALSLDECLPELWDLAGYRKDDYYPNDALVRHAALAAILKMTLAREDGAAPATPEPAATEPAPPESETADPPAEG